MTLAIVQTKDIFIQTNGELIPKKEERVKTEKTALLEPQIAKQRSKKNQEILMFTCTAFFLFAMAEVVGAIASNSLSLLGDAGAMSIDVFTYVCNIYAERLKAGDVEISARMRFILEIFIPMISLFCLLLVTAYVTSEAIHVIQNPSEDHDVVNIWFLYGFSGANVLVDGLSSWMFFRKGDEDVFLSYRIQKRINSYSGLSTYEDDVEVGKTNCQEMEKSCSHGNSSNGNISGNINGNISNGGSSIHNHVHNHHTHTHNHGIHGYSHSHSSISSRANLNMISAFTHLTGDSMRTLSVIVAALISTIFKIPSNICDAWAAIVVTITISFMVIPLVREIYIATTVKK